MCIVGSIKKHRHTGTGQKNCSFDREFKDSAEGNFATIPKSEFPRLLGKLLDNNYETAVINGFATTGLFPFDPQKVLGKLPPDEIPDHQTVEGQLLQRLSDMRYGKGPAKRAARPSKKDKLPAGESYTCRGGDQTEQTEDNSSGSEDDPEVNESSSGSEREEDGGPDGGRDSGQDSGQHSGRDDRQDDRMFESDTEDRAEEEKRSRNVRSIIRKLRKKCLDNWTTAEGTVPVNDPGSGPSSEPVEEEEGEGSTSEEDDPEMIDYQPRSYVAAVYDDDWHVGQILDKEVEPEAEKGDKYVFVNFMEKRKQFRWPEKLDLLNVLKKDILCVVKAPKITIGTSSSRAVSFQLDQKDLKKVVEKFQFFKAWFSQFRCRYLYRYLLFHCLS